MIKTKRLSYVTSCLIISLCANIYTVLRNVGPFYKTQQWLVVIDSTCDEEFCDDVVETATKKLNQTTYALTECGRVLPKDTVVPDGVRWSRRFPILHEFVIAQNDAIPTEGSRKILITLNRPNGNNLYNANFWLLRATDDGTWVKSSQPTTDISRV